MRILIIIGILLNLYFESLAQTTPTLDVAPNPFVDTTSFIFTLPTSDTVSLVVYDRWGQLIDSLIKEQVMPSGTHTVIFIGDTLPQDMYVILLDVGTPWITKEFIKLDQLVGLRNDELEEQCLTIYPNPFSGSATVKLNQQVTFENSQLEIYDIIGRKVKTYNFSKNQATLTLQANQIGTGMFFIRLVSNGSIVANQKVIITN